MAGSPLRLARMTGSLRSASTAWSRVAGRKWASGLDSPGPDGWPGSRDFSTPSSPAAMVVAMARYGLAEPSPERNSIRLLSGTRIMWVRSFPPKDAFRGDQVAPEELVVAPVLL